MVLISLGSNIGDRCYYLKTAIAKLESAEQITVKKVSSFYETEPFGLKEQEWFLNAVVVVETNFQPLQLLDFCQQIEMELQRRREIHWGPRTIDIDILTYDDLSFKTERLILPHPYLTLRRFVLIPAAEICEQKLLDGKSASELLVCCPDNGIVRRYEGECS